MCAYEIPDPVEAAIKRLLENGVTDTATIAGRLHTHEFALHIGNRMRMVEQVKENYTPTTPQYTVSDAPLSDEALDEALDARS